MADIPAPTERNLAKVTHLRMLDKIKIAEAKATRDSLTGLHNRGYFEEQLNSLSVDDNYAIVLIDIDNFKEINDKNGGHPVGDKVLKTLSRILQDNFQIVEGDSPDVVSRYGGDEFAIILRNISDKDLVHDRLNFLRTTIASHRVDPTGRNLKFTTSIGVAFNDNSSSPTDILNKADMALYQAKETGRNKVVMSQSD